MTNPTNTTAYRIESTTSAEVCVRTADRTTTLSWERLVEAATQPDPVGAAAYRPMLDSAIDAEAERISYCDVAIDARVVAVAVGAAYRVEIGLMVGGYDIYSPALKREAHEGGQLPSEALAEAELAERVARISVSRPGVRRTAAEMTSPSEIRAAVVRRHAPHLAPSPFTHPMYR